MTPILTHRLRGEQQFERMYQRHVADVYRYAFAVLRNAADAEDVAQTTFLNAYRAWENGERPRAPHNWLIAIAHNVCRQRFRQAQRRVEEVTYDDAVAETLVDDDDAPSVEDIRRALGHIPFNQRAALVMRELEGRSYAEIAEILDLSVSAVETLIFRARRALREQLEGGVTCADAELAISRQLDGRLPRSERGPLRAHLRECKECATLARKQRAQRSAVRALGTVPLPSSLGSFFGGGAAGGGAALGGGVAMKALAAGAAALLVGGAATEGVKRAFGSPERDRVVAPSAHDGVLGRESGERSAAARERRRGMLEDARGHADSSAAARTRSRAKRKRARAEGRGERTAGQSRVVVRDGDRTGAHGGSVDGRDERSLATSVRAGEPTAPAKTGADSGSAPTTRASQPTSPLPALPVTTPESVSTPVGEVKQPSVTVPEVKPPTVTTPEVKPPQVTVPEVNTPTVTVPSLPPLPSTPPPPSVTVPTIPSVPPTPSVSPPKLP